MGKKKSKHVFEYITRGKLIIEAVDCNEAIDKFKAIVESNPEREELIDYRIIKWKEREEHNR